MDIEIIVNQYFVIEHKTYEICDSPCIGASEVIDKGTEKYGPFSHTCALQKKRDLTTQRLSEGWRETNDKDHFVKGNYDLWYSIKKETVQTIPLHTLVRNIQKSINEELQ